MAKLLTEQEVKQVLFTPNDAVKAALEAIEDRRRSGISGVGVGLPGVDDYLLPGRPGEMIGVIGRSRHYKSGFMQWWARTTAHKLAQMHDEEHNVVYVTWEQAIDEMICWDLAYTARMNAIDVIQGKVSDEEMQRLRMVHGPRRIVTPLYLIGHSTREQRHRPRLSMAAVEQCLYSMIDEFKLKPSIVFLDYLQQMEPDEGQDRRMQVFYNVHRCKDMALSMSCPVVVGTQANRESYTDKLGKLPKWGIPPFTSSQESSNFEQTCDKMIGVWYPIRDHPNGGKLETKQVTLDITSNLLILQILKQKIGPSGKWWPLRIEPEINDIHELVML